MRSEDVWGKICLELYALDWRFSGLFATAVAQGQVTQSAEGAGQSLRVGTEFSNLQAGFPINSNVRLSGVGVFGNFNWNYRYMVLRRKPAF